MAPGYNGAMAQQQQQQPQNRNPALAQQSFSSVQQFPQRVSNPMAQQNQPPMMGQNVQNVAQSVGQNVSQHLLQVGPLQRPPMQRQQLYLVANQTALTPGLKIGFSPVPQGDSKQLHSGSNSHAHTTPLMVQQNTPAQFKMPGGAMMPGPKGQQQQPGQVPQQNQQQQPQRGQMHLQELQPTLQQLLQLQKLANGAANGNLLETSLNSPHLGSVMGPGVNGTAGANAMKANGVNSAAQNEINAKIFKRNLGNAGVMRILDLIDIVSNEPYERVSTLEFWTRFIQSYFAPNAVMRFTPAATAPKPPSDSYIDGFVHPPSGRLYELDVLTAPRFLVASVLSQSLTKHQITLPGIKSQVMNNGSVFIASQLNLQFSYGDGTSGSVQGTCRISLNKDYRIDWIDCRCTSYQPMISIASLEKDWQQHQNGDHLEANGASVDFIERLRESAQSVRTSNNSGIHDTAMRIMQIGDLMTYLKPLMSFSLTNGITLPMRALEGYMAASSGSHLQRLGSVSTANGAASSPSPRTVTQDEPKNILKKRRLSELVNSPMVPEARRN